jgi:hypothetical protein
VKLKKQAESEYLAKLDSYELPPHFPFDPSKMKPNRFAGRVKLSRTSVRRAPSRKRAAAAVERHTITLTKSHAKYLRRLDANLSRAIRKLIAKTK